VPGILAIFNDAILHTTASWNYDPTTLAARMEWYEEHRKQGLPVFVADDGGVIAGWGALHAFRAPQGYHRSVEHSVYVAAEYRGRGIGRELLVTLIDSARALGKHAMVAGIDGENEVSIRLHRSLGFEQVGHLKQVGYKFDRWLDLIFMQLILAQD
jgi:phosphinothricin acetyltransferase